MRKLVVVLVMAVVLCAPVLASAACFKIDGLPITIKLDIAGQVSGEPYYSLVGWMRHYCATNIVSPASGSGFTLDNGWVHFGFTAASIFTTTCEPVIVEGLLYPPAYQSGVGWAWLSSTGTRYEISFSPSACE